MSVLEKIRSSTDSTWMRAILVIIALVFLFWGVGSSSSMQTTQAVARVNGKRITDTELQRRMRDQVNASGRSSMDEDQMRALNKQVLDALITDEVVLQEAYRAGLEVSDEEIQRYILEIDAFKDDQGRFSSEIYGRALKRLGYTKARFEEQTRAEMMRGKLREVVASGVVVTTAEIRELYMQNATQAELRFVRIQDSEIARRVVVEDAEIDRLLAANADQVQAAYEQDKARLYNQPRRIGIHRILMRKGVEGIEDSKVQARMEELRGRIAAGEDFEALARAWSEDLTAESGGNAGTVPEPAMEPRLASAAIAAGPGGLSPVVETDNAFVILRVDEITEARLIPLDEVKRDIARTILARQKASSEAEALAARLLEDWKAQGQAPVEQLAALGLRLQDTGPFSPKDGFIPNLGMAPAVNQAVLAQGGTGLLGQVLPVEGGRVLAEVSGWTAADESRFEAIAEMVRMQLLQQKQQEVLDQWEGQLVAQARVERLLAP